MLVPAALLLLLVVDVVVDDDVDVSSPSQTVQSDAIPFYSKRHTPHDGVAPPLAATAALLLLVDVDIVDDVDVSFPPQQSNPMQSRFTANTIRHTLQATRSTGVKGVRG